MNIKSLVKITNILAMTGILLLIYWVFGFILITVFGLKVFERNLTEMFGLSILGILAVLAGALILNIMLNLTRIADERAGAHPVSAVGERSASQAFKRFVLMAVAAFPSSQVGCIWAIIALVSISLHSCRHQLSRS